MTSRRQGFVALVVSSDSSDCPDRLLGHIPYHLYAKLSPQFGSWAERDAGWADDVSPQARPHGWPGPARNAATGRLGVSTGRSEQAYLRAKNGTADCGRSARVGQGWGWQSQPQRTAEEIRERPAAQIPCQTRLGASDTALARQTGCV